MFKFGGQVGGVALPFGKMSLVISIIMVAGFVIGVFFFLERMAPVENSPEVRRWLLLWTLKGIATPAFLWMFFNLGLFERVPSLVMEVDMAHGWQRAVAFDSVAATGLFVIGTYWVGLTFVWLLGTLRERTELRREFNSTVLIWSLFLAPIAFLIVKACGWGYAGVAGAAWFAPLAWSVLPLLKLEKVKPHYNRAIVNLQFDRYEEAEAEVLKELEKCEDDFEGWMMLAELYANHFNDLAGAAKIIHETCDLPDAPAPSVAGAFHQLADWHLKLGEDPEAARRVLLLIDERLPGTHLGHMAKLRASRLPANRRELLEQRKAKTYRLPSLGRRLDEAVKEEPTVSDVDEAAALANRCVERLKDNPDNIDAREELARVLAERLHKVQAGLDQLELLLSQPNQPALKRAEWMALMATWQLIYRQDKIEGKRILQKLIRDFPEAPQAFAAKRRLNLLEVEEWMRSQRQNVKEFATMGSNPAV